ncbi:MAG TPA: DUF1736 domain-containing protein, partial [Bacteroidetes bacterium]|nr:DUF1736 domain-containing protein [Bacteroidota bacterium]
MVCPKIKVVNCFFLIVNCLMTARKSKKGKRPSRKKPVTTAPTRRRNERYLYLLAGAIALFGFLLYANTLTHGYVLDDFSQIKENFVTRQGWEGIGTQWKTHARYGYRPGPGELYRPVPMTLFSLEWEVAPDNPSFAHFINVLLYALTGAVLFVTLARIWKKYNILFPLLTTLFFMAHPVHTEVVANIKSLDEIVMFLMAILALRFLWQYLEKEKIKWLVVSWVFYAVALFSKESAITFLATFPLFVYFFTQKKPAYIFRLVIPYVVLAGVFVFVRSRVVGALGAPAPVSVLDNFLAGAQDPATRLASAFLILGKYLWVLIFPHPLGSDFGYNQIPLTGFSDWRVLLSVAAWTGMGVYAVLKLKSKNILSFAILFFIINFSISSNLLITIGTSYGERLLYAASPAFAMALACFILKIFNEKENTTNRNDTLSTIFKNKKLWSTVAVMLALYSIKTIDRNADWATSFTLYQEDLKVAPNSAKLNFHYGLELVKKGNEAKNEADKKQWYEKAKKHFFKATEIFPQYADAWGQLGLAFYRDKNFEKALEYYNLALKYRPRFPLVHSNMGTLYS